MNRQMNQFDDGVWYSKELETAHSFIEDNPILSYLLPEDQYNRLLFDLETLDREIEEWNGGINVT